MRRRPATPGEAFAPQLEAGEVVCLPDRAFRLSGEEAGLLTPEMPPSGDSKNVSLDPATGVVSGAAAGGEAELARLMERFAD